MSAENRAGDGSTRRQSLESGFYTWIFGNWLLHLTASPVEAVGTKRTGCGLSHGAEGCASLGDEVCELTLGLSLLSLQDCNVLVLAAA